MNDTHIKRYSLDPDGGITPNETGDYVRLEDLNFIAPETEAQLIFRYEEWLAEVRKERDRLFIALSESLKLAECDQFNDPQRFDPVKALLKEIEASIGESGLKALRESRKQESKEGKPF